MSVLDEIRKARAKASVTPERAVQLENTGLVNPKFSRDAYQQAVNNYLGSGYAQSLFPGMYRHAQTQQGAQEVLNNLTSNQTFAPKLGDEKSLSPEAVRTGLMDRYALLNQLGSSKVFDNRQFALGGYHAYSSGDYLKGLLGELRGELDVSKQKDLDWQNGGQDAWYDYTTRTSAVKNKLAEMDAQGRNYYDTDILEEGDILWLDRVVNGNERWAPNYASQADVDRYNALVDQWAEIDWDEFSLADHLGIEAPQEYKSDTEYLQYQADKLQRELDNRAEIERLTGIALGLEGFGELSQYETSDAFGENFDPRNFTLFGDYSPIALHEYINTGDTDVKFRMMEGGSEIVDRWSNAGYDWLAPDEISVYNALYSSGDKAGAQQYLDALESRLLQRRADYQEILTGNYATGNIVTAGLSWLGAGLSTIPNALNYPLMAIQAMSSNGLDPNSALGDYGRFHDTVGQAQGKWIDENAYVDIGGKNLTKMVYNTFSSGRDSLIAMGAGYAVGASTGMPKLASKVAGFIQNSNAASSTLMEDLANGWSDTGATLHSLGAYMVSGATEKYSIDAFFSDPKGYFLNFLKSGGIEMSEETAERFLSPLVDKLSAEISGNYGEWDRLANDLVGAERYRNRDEAMKAIAEDWMRQLPEVWFTSFLTGSLLGGTSAGIQIGQDIGTGKAVQKDGDVDALISIGAEMDPDSDSYQAAQELMGQQKKGKKLSLRNIGKLVNSLTGDIKGQAAETVKKIYEESITKRLVELGEDFASATNLASAIRKMAAGETLTVTERGQIRWSDAADLVAKEILTETKSGDENRVGQSWKTEMTTMAEAASDRSQKKIVEAAGAMSSKARAAAAVEKAAEDNAKKAGTAAEDAVSAAKEMVEAGKGKLDGASDTGVVYDTADGEATGSLARFEQTADGNLEAVVTAETEDGKTAETKVSLDSITGGANEMTGAVIASINKGLESGRAISAAEASTMLQAAKQAGNDVKGFVSGFQRIYDAGYSGLDMPATAIDPKLAQIIYDQGKAEGVANEETRLQKAKEARSNANPVTGWIGDVETDADVRGMGDAEALEKEYENMTAGEQLVVDLGRELSKHTGLNVVYYRSKANAAGRMVTKNGAYIAGTHSIYLDVNSGIMTAEEAAKRKKEGTLGYAVMRTMGHEVTHAIELTSTEYYAKYKQAVKKELYAKGQDWATLVRKKIDVAAAGGDKISYAEAEAEVVADASEYMLQDSQFVKNLDAGLKKKVKRIIQDFMSKVRAAFRQIIGSGHQEARALLDGMGHYSKTLQDLWDAGFAEMAGKEVQADFVDERGGNIKKSERDIDEYASVTEEDFHKNGRIYDYDFLIKQKPISVVVIPSVNTLMGSGSFKRAEIVEQGKNNIPGEENELGHKQVKNVYTGRTLSITNNSIRHGLNGEKTRILANAQIGLMIGDVVKNGIPINGLSTTDRNAIQTYAMVTPCVTEDGKAMMAVTHVDIQKNEVNSVTFTDLVHSANGRIYKKSEPGSYPIDVQGLSLHHPSRFIISISDLLEDVNMSFKSLLSDDVLDRLGEKRPDKGLYTGRVLYSRRENGEETEADVYEKYLTVSKQLNEAREKKRAALRMMKESGEEEAVYDLMSKDMEEGVKEYKKLLDKYGLSTLNDDVLQKNANELYNKWEKLRDQELAEEELRELEKTGKTMQEFHREKAVKEFGYTPYFYDAGYILPNGKMLNFSGEKGKHYGSRGQDHRAIGSVFAVKQGSEAMIEFMAEGNIRIMPESPGVDITASVEPTAQQYATIRKFVREYMEDEYMNIDFTNEKGDVVGNLEYEGKIYPDRVINDIKYYYQTGKIREQGIEKFRYSRREEQPDSVSIREYLGGMKPTERMNETEKLMLKKYQENLKTLEEKEKLIAEQVAIIEGGATGEEKMKAINRRNIYKAQANRASKALLEAESSDGFARVMATSQEVVNRYLLGSAGTVADAADMLDSEISGLSKQLKAVEADISRAAAGQRAAFARGLFDQKQLNAAAMALKSNYGSKMSATAIADRLALVYGEMYADRTANGAKRFAEAAKKLAEDILQKSKYRYKSEVLETLANEVGAISLTETDQQEIRNAGLTISQYKKAVAPYVKVTEKASDQYSYASSAAYYGQGTLASILGDDTEGNLAMRLYDVINREKTMQQEISFEGMSEGQTVAMVMADIAGASLPMSTNNKTIEYLRKEMLSYAGESEETVKKIETAINKAKNASARASNVWRAAVQEMNTAKAAVEYYRKLEEQRRLTELREQKQEIKDQLKSDYATKLAEKVKKNREEFREREKKAREYRITRDELNKIRRRIERNIKRINTLRMRETDAKHVPQEMQHVTDLVMQIFTSSSLSRLAFSAEKTASLARRYRALQELETDTTYYWDDEIEGAIENLTALGEAYSAIRERSAGVPSYFSLEGVQLETEILQGVDNIVSNVLRMIDSANDAFLTGRTETFNAYANMTGEELLSKDDHKVYKGGWGKMQTALDEMLRTGNMTPIYYIEHLNSPLIKEVFDQVRSGQRYYAQIIEEGKEFVQNAKTKYHYGAWANSGKLKMKTSQGHMIELTREEAAELYAIAKREKNNKLYQTEHLLYGGFQYKHLENKVAEDKKTTVTNKPHPLDAADIDQISNWLTDEQKAYADELVGYLSTTMADYGNQAAMNMFGYKKFTESYYVPFHTSAEQRFLKGDEGPEGETAGTGRLKNSGFTRKLQHKANATLMVGGLTDTVTEHIHKMATYAAMVEPIENMKRLLNHKVVEEDGTVNTIRALIGQKYGKASQNYMTQLLKDLNGAAQGDQRATDAVNKLVGAFKRGAVLASASVVLQQPTAMTRAMAMVSPKYFAQNPFYRPGKGTWDEMMKYSGTAIIKDMGKFDVGMGLTASQYIADEHLKVIEAYNRLKNESKWQAGKAAYKRFMDWLTAAPGKADQWTWGLIWKAVKAEQAAKNPGMDVNSEAFLQMCGARFDDVIDHTQVYDSVITRSNLMRSKNAAHQMATSFMSEPTLSLNMLYDAFFGKHDGKQRGAIIVSVMTSQVLAGAIAALAQAWNDDEDKRNWLERYADRATGNILSNVNPLGWMPYVSDLMSMLEGYTVERPDMSVIADLLSYGKSFFSKATDPDVKLGWKDYENFVGTLANMTGLPAKNISREMRRTWNLIVNSQWTTPDAFNVGQAMIENLPGYDSKNKTYYERIVEAELRGDTDKAENYREYMLLSKMVSEDALRKGLKSAMEAAYIAGDTDEDTAVDYLQKIGAYESEDDAYWEVKKWDSEKSGSTESYSKYNEFYAAVETGANLKGTIQMYLDHGVSKSTLASQITNKYKKQLIDLKKSGKGYADLQARLLTAYEALGYDRSKKLKDIQKWMEKTE